MDIARGHSTGQRALAPAAALLPDLAIFLAALLLRLGHVLGSTDAPASQIPIIDAATYHDIARALVGGEGIRNNLFWRPALYPLFLTGVYAVAGVSVLAAQVAQAFLGAVTCVLTRRLGVRLGGRGIGLAAGLITAAYGPLIFHESELLATGMAAFWTVALLLLLTGGRRHWWWAPAWGICGGLAVLTRTEFLPFFLLASVGALVAAARAEGAPRPALRRGALVAAGFAAVALPAALLNARLTGFFTFLPASGGVNLWIGNNPDPCRAMAIRSGWAWDRLLGEAAREGARDDWEGQRHFLKKTLRFVREEPGRYLAGLGDKACQLVSAREIPRNVDVYSYRRWSPVLRPLVWKSGRFGFPFGILLPLAAAGALLARRRLGWPVALFLLSYAAALILVFVSARHRVSLAPVLAILAALGAAGLAGAVRRRAWRPLGAASVAAAFALVVAVAPGPFCAEAQDLDAELFCLVGAEKLRQGRVQEAAADFRTALQHDPRYAEAHNYLGAALATLGDRAGAFAHLLTALEINPELEYAANNLGLLLAAEGRVDEALEQYRRAIAANPSFADAYVNAGNLLAARRRREEAEAFYRKALALRPGFERARAGLESLPR